VIGQGQSSPIHSHEGEKSPPQPHLKREGFLFLFQQKVKQKRRIKHERRIKQKRREKKKKDFSALAKHNASISRTP
jgi:hypothetical protein